MEYPMLGMHGGAQHQEMPDFIAFLMPFFVHPLLDDPVHRLLGPGAQSLWLDPRTVTSAYPHQPVAFVHCVLHKEHRYVTRFKGRTSRHAFSSS
jgi:hypothetical protein